MEIFTKKKCLWLSAKDFQKYEHTECDRRQNTAQRSRHRLLLVPSNDSCSTGSQPFIDTAN